MRRAHIIATVVGLVATGVGVVQASAVLPVSTPVPITGCGQRVTGAAYLTGDLDCSSSTASHGIVFEAKRTGILEMNGFSIAGPPHTGPGTAAIRCESKCVIYGQGGAVTSAEGWGIAAVNVAIIYDLTIHDTGRRGIDIARTAGKSVAKIYNTTITRTGHEAVTGDRLVLERCTLTDNGLLGLAPGALPAIHGHAIRISETTITGNQGAGAEGVRARFRDSVVVNNGLHSTCGTTANCNFDVGSMRKIRIENTTCNYSFDASACDACPGHVELTPITDPALNNWGVCALD